MPPFLFGGNGCESRVEENNLGECSAKVRGRHSNVAGVVATGAAVDYLNKIGLDNILSHEQKLAKKTVSLLPKSME